MMVPACPDTDQRAGALGVALGASRWLVQAPGAGAGPVRPPRYNLKQFYAASVETLHLGGKQYGLPDSAHPGFCGHFVNLDALAQSGIPEPNDATWTFRDLEDLAKSRARRR